MAAAPARTPYAVAARQLLRNTLLDAACDLLARHKWGDITMAAVAGEAGVSRQTLYNEFGSRDEFAQALVLRDGDRFLTRVEATLRDHRDDPAAALAAAFEMFLRGAAEDPLIRALLSGDGSDELLPLITTQGSPILERATAGLANALAENWPGATPREATVLAECLVRVALSFVALPQSPAGIDPDTVARLFGPYLASFAVHES
jgi:AcrR family transcriptional regulator